MNICPQTKRLCFFVIDDTKSINAGRFLGNPVNATICGLIKKTKGHLYVSWNKITLDIQSSHGIIIQLKLIG